MHQKIIARTFLPVLSTSKIGRPSFYTGRGISPRTPGGPYIRTGDMFCRPSSFPQCFSVNITQKASPVLKITKKIIARPKNHQKFISPSWRAQKSVARPYHAPVIINDFLYLISAEIEIIKSSISGGEHLFINSLDAGVVRNWNFFWRCSRTVFWLVVWHICLTFSFFIFRFRFRFFTRRFAALFVRVTKK